jgi:hypothetical protein
VDAKKHTAAFNFSATGDVTSMQCALVRVPTAKKGKTPTLPAPSYNTCTTPETYRHLKAGTYVFYVRAVGPGGDAAPVSHRFKIA